VSTGASLNRHNSEQIVCTPPEFLDAVARRFGRPTWDLAATRENSVSGPDRCFTEADDGLAQKWPGGLCWLNPPFGGIEKWAAKCAEERERGVKILLLVPASIGSCWFRDHIQGKALVVPLAGRVKFVGHATGFPKDLMLCVYGFGVTGFAEQWEWRPPRKKRGKAVAKLDVPGE
jgi:phage N-6-adenine-methyltransferase